MDAPGKPNRKNEILYQEVVEHDESPKQHTEKSLNRSISHPTIHKDAGTMHESQEDLSKGLKTVDPSEIELQLEDALENEKRKSHEISQSPQQDSLKTNLEELRDPRFFMSKVDEESLEDTAAKPKAHDFGARRAQPASPIESPAYSESKPAPSFDDLSNELSEKKERSQSLFAPSSASMAAKPNASAIKVEN